jgi:hypothetical protein
MTAPLLRVRNSTGGLVLSTNGPAFGLNYIGIASQQLLSQASGSITTGGGRQAGRSTYRITSVNRPVPFIGMPLDRTVRVQSVVSLGANVWEITVFCGAAPLDSSGFETQEWVSVYCFAQPATFVGNVGLRVRDDTGALRWSITDLSGRPLFLKGSFALAGVVGELDVDTSMVALTTPAVLGMPQSFGEDSTPDGAFYDLREIDYGWRRTGSTTVRQDSYTSRRRRNDGPGSNTTTARPARALLIDANGLT